MADTLDESKRNEATDIGEPLTLSTPPTDDGTEHMVVENVTPLLARRSVKEEEEIYRPLTVVKCHTNLLKLSEKELSITVNAAGETALNKEKMESTLLDTTIALSKVAEQVTFHAIEGAISDLQLERKNRVVDDQKKAQIFRAEIEYHEVVMETVDDTMISHSDKQFGMEENIVPKKDETQQKTQWAIQQEGGDTTNQLSTQKLKINDESSQSLPLIMLTTSCGKSDVLFSRSVENMTNCSNKTMAESHSPNMAMKVLDIGTSQGSLFKDDTLNSISAPEPESTKKMQSFSVETCEDEGEKTEPSCSILPSKSSEISVSRLSRIGNRRTEEKAEKQTERGGECGLKPEACQVEPRSPETPDATGSPCPSHDADDEPINGNDNMKDDFLLAEAEAQFFAEFQLEAGGEIMVPAASIDQMTKEGVQRANVSSQCSGMIPSTSVDESNTSPKKPKPITTDWVSAKPFMPRQPPISSYNPKVFNNQQPVYEGSSQYFNNNNCHHRGESQQHIVSAENERSQLEYNDTSELLDNVGEDNSSDEVLDIIVLPDQQSKQRQHAQTQAPPGNLSLRGHGLPCFRPPRFLNPPNQRPMMPRPPYPPHGPFFNRPPPGFPRQPRPGYPLQARPSHNPSLAPRLAPNGHHVPPGYPALRPPLPPPPPHSGPTPRHAPPTLRPTPPSNAPPPRGPPPLAINLPPPPTASFNNLMDTPNGSKLCSVQDSMVPYREIDGCCYFDPSFVPDKPPPGVEFGYPQRGKRRKAARLSSRFPTQAGKFHHHANFYVRNCAETAMSNPHDSG